MNRFAGAVAAAGLACMSLVACMDDAQVIRPLPVSGPDDVDGDGILNASDNCAVVPNPEQRDCNSDGIGDRCSPADCDGDGVEDQHDNCPTEVNPAQVDAEADSHGEACDNCPGVSNEQQRDRDGDGMGDRCDADCNGDGLADATVDADGVNGPGDFDGDAYDDDCDPSDTNAAVPGG